MKNYNKSILAGHFVTDKKFARAKIRYSSQIRQIFIVRLAFGCQKSIGYKEVQLNLLT